MRQSTRERRQTATNHNWRRRAIKGVTATALTTALAVLPSACTGSGADVRPGHDVNTPAEAGARKVIAARSLCKIAGVVSTPPPAPGIPRSRLEVTLVTSLQPDAIPAMQTYKDEDSRVSWSNSYLTNAKVERRNKIETVSFQLNSDVVLSRDGIERGIVVPEDTGIAKKQGVSPATLVLEPMADYAKDTPMEFYIYGVASTSNTVNHWLRKDVTTTITETATIHCGTLHSDGEGSWKQADPTETIPPVDPKSIVTVSESW